MQAAPAHIYGLHAGLRPAFRDRLFMRFHHHVVVLDQAAEGPQGKGQHMQRLIRCIADIKHQPAFAHCKPQHIRPGQLAHGVKAVMVQQIRNRLAPIGFRIGGRGRRFFRQFNADQALFRHPACHPAAPRRLHRLSCQGASSSQSPHP